MAATIADILNCPPPPAGSAYARAQQHYDTLLELIDDWNTISSHSHEGESFTRDLARHESKMLTYYDAYQKALATAAAVTTGASPGTDPRLLAPSGSRRFTWRGTSLHDL